MGENKTMCAEGYLQAVQGTPHAITQVHMSEKDGVVALFSRATITAAAPGVTSPKAGPP